MAILLDDGTDGVLLARRTKADVDSRFAAVSIGAHDALIVNSRDVETLKVVRLVEDHE